MGWNILNFNIFLIHVGHKFIFNLHTSTSSDRFVNTWYMRSFSLGVKCKICYWCFTNNTNIHFHKNILNFVSSWCFFIVIMSLNKFLLKSMTKFYAYRITLSKLIEKDTEKSTIKYQNLTVQLDFNFELNVSKLLERQYQI